MKRRKARISIGIAAALTLLPCATGCGTRPSEVLSDDDMCSLMTDMYKAGSLLSIDFKMSLNDTARYKLRESVLAAHNVDEKQFQRSLDWYGHHIDDYHEIFEQVEENLRKEASGAGSAVAGPAQAGIWPHPSRQYLSPRTGTESMSFEISGGEIRQGATLEWDAVAKTTGSGITAVMGVEYTDGTGEYKRQQYLSAGNIHLALPLDASRKAKRVFGYTTLGRSVVAPAVIDSISLAFIQK